MFLMVNEAARCVEEKVVESPEDADYGMILGTGFRAVLAAGRCDSPNILV